MTGILQGLQGMFGGGGSSSVPSYESLQKRREIAEMLMQKTMGTQANSVGEGVGQLAQALMYRMSNKKLEEQEDQERARAAEVVTGIKSRLGDEGITEDALAGLAQARENPYLSPEMRAITTALMRRKLIPGEMMPQQAMGAPQMAQGTPPMFPPQGMQQQAPQAMPQAAPMAPQTPQEPSAGPVMPQAAMPPQEPAAPPQMPEAPGGMAPPQAPAMPPQMPAAPQQSGIQAVLSALNPVGAANAGEMPPPQDPMAPMQPAPPDAAPLPDRGLKLTEGQSKNLSFWNRMNGVGEDLDRLESVLTDRWEATKGAVPLIGNSLVSEEYQRGRRAGEEWVTSILRPDTGAAVTEPEMAIYQQQYIPQPGDSPGQLADKRAARKRAEQGLRAGLGLAAPIAGDLEATRPKTEAKRYRYNPETGEIE